MTEYAVVLDPGVTTGYIWASWSPVRLPTILDKREIPGGLDGLADMLDEPEFMGGWSHFICEKFRMTPRVRTSEQVEPLRIEGLARTVAGPEIIWQYPDQMLLAGGHHGSPGRNKTAADNVLRDMGLWTLPSEVDNHADANDINSAMKHLVAYLRNQNHAPTLEALGV